MPASWLYQIDGNGLLLTPEMMARLREGGAAALRTLNRQPLTKLYRAKYTRPRREDAIGLFWTDVPPLECIPVVRGRHSPGPWIKDYLLCEVLKSRRNTLYPPNEEERAERSVRAMVKFTLKQMKRGEQTVLVKKEGGCLKAWNMKPNPKFDLIVVNRHDRVALLKLLSDLDSTANVENWLAERTLRRGATAPSVLHADYVAWCERESEAWAGMKGFVQALVAAGVTKLTRGAGNARYELELC